jgi:hypothetical protein
MVVDDQNLDGHHYLGGWNGAQPLLAALPGFAIEVRRGLVRGPGLPVSE